MLGLHSSAVLPHAPAMLYLVHMHTNADTNLDTGALELHAPFSQADSHRRARKSGKLPFSFHSLGENRERHPLTATYALDHGWHVSHKIKPKWILGATLHFPPHFVTSQSPQPHRTAHHLITHTCDLALTSVS